MEPRFGISNNGISVALIFFKVLGLLLTLKTLIQKYTNGYTNSTLFSLTLSLKVIRLTGSDYGRNVQGHRSKSAF